MKLHALSFAEVQEIREAFSTLGAWTGLPIVPDRLEGRSLIRGEGRASLLKFESTMVAPDGTLGEFLCYSPSLRRFFIYSATDNGSYRVSENTIGVMVNPTTHSSRPFARTCYRYLLAKEQGSTFEAEWLADPVLWPKTLTRPEELVQARKAIGDLRPGETVVRARALFGDGFFLARHAPGASWRDLDWHSPTGEQIDLAAHAQRPLAGLRTWAVFLNSFLRHAVGFSLDADGRRADGHTRGLLRPAPILLVGATRTGRTEWADGRSAETVLPDPREWDRIVGDLAGISETDLARAGLRPRTARAMRAGRRPTYRNAGMAKRLVAQKARAQAGIEQDRSRPCIAPGCGEDLSGRQRYFCFPHARYPGTRRKAWKEAAT